MASLKYILLIVGILSIIASIYLMISTGEIVNEIFGLVCGAGLIWGYFEVRRRESKTEQNFPPQTLFPLHYSTTFAP